MREKVSRDIRDQLEARALEFNIFIEGESVPFVHPKHGRPVDILILFASRNLYCFLFCLP